MAGCTTSPEHSPTARPVRTADAATPTPAVGGGAFVPRALDRDPQPNDPQRSVSIWAGAQIANHTAQLAAPYVGSALACTDCHLNGGQEVGAWPWVGAASQYPDYDPRSGRVITLQERLQSCFMRSESGSAPPLDGPLVTALADYITWLSEGQPVGQNPPWRQWDMLPVDDRIPIEQLQPTRGQELYAQQCASCHGVSGQGIGNMPPLWGPRAFNDGAGTARVYTLAGYIHETMPLSPPGRLTYEEAQQIAAFVDSQPRPVYAGKAQDYPDGNVPVDAVYYPQRYPQNPLQR
jgi:thiosulfate dehydrogenase